MLDQQQKFDALVRLGIDLNQIKDLDILMERILAEARRFVSADAGSIYIREDHSLRFTYTQNETLQTRLGKGEKLIFSSFSMPISDNSIAGFVARSGELLNLPDVYNLDPGCSHHFDKTFDRKTQYLTRSILTLPLVTSNNDLVGVLQIINARDAAGHVIPFSRPDENTMMHFASIAAVALERAQMTRTILLRMMKMAEMRDPKETGSHVNRVAGYTKEAWEESAVLSRIRSESGGYFDPELVEIFFDCLDVLRSIQKRYRDTEN